MMAKIAWYRKEFSKTMREPLRSAASGKSGDCLKFLPFTRFSNFVVDKNKKHLGQNDALEYRDLAHDAGNLLNVLSLYSDLLAFPGVLTKEYRAYAVKIKISSDRSYSLVNRLANHIHLLYGCSSKNSEVVLPNVVDHYLKLLGKVDEDRKDDEGFQVLCVPEEAGENILANLLENTGQTISKDGLPIVRIEGWAHGLACRREGHQSCVLFTVGDNGWGMSRATLLRLRQSRFRHSIAGCGLGTHVVRESASSSGRSFNVAYHLRVGTHVLIEWYAQSNDLTRGRSEILAA